MTLELILTSDRFRSVGIKISGIDFKSGARILTTRYYQNDYSRNNYSDDKYHQP